jgi:hypothetical protein
MKSLTDQQICHQFESGAQDVDSLIAPLLQLAEESSSLIVGYGTPQAGVRKHMIPYFHICGTEPVQVPIRALILGGWVGTESITPYAVARMVAALEARLQLVNGLEVTAYPVINLEAHRAGVFLTDKQQLHGVSCWEGSPCSHIKVLEKELLRYEYDVIIVLREHVRSHDADVEAWLAEDEQKAVLSDCLSRHASVSPNFRWRVNPVRPTYARALTPIPQANRQPAEIVIGLPGALTPKAQAQEALMLALTLCHAARQGREEGLM